MKVVLGITSLVIAGLLIRGKNSNFEKIESDENPRVSVSNIGTSANRSRTIRAKSLGDRDDGTVVIFDELGDKTHLSGLSKRERQFARAVSEERERLGFFTRMQKIEPNPSGIISISEPVSPDDYKERLVTTWEEARVAISDSHLINAPVSSEPKYFHEGPTHIFFGFDQIFGSGYVIDRKTGIVSSWRKR